MSKVFQVGGPAVPIGLGKCQIFSHPVLFSTADWSVGLGVRSTVSGSSHSIVTLSTTVTVTVTESVGGFQHHFYLLSKLIRDPPRRSLELPRKGIQLQRSRASSQFPTRDAALFGNKFCDAQRSFDCVSICSQAQKNAQGAFFPSSVFESMNVSIPKQVCEKQRGGGRRFSFFWWLPCIAVSHVRKEKSQGKKNEQDV